MTCLLKEDVSIITSDPLKFNNVPASKSYLRKQLQSHPYYPNLVSVSDALKELKLRILPSCRLSLILIFEKDFCLKF